MSFLMKVLSGSHEGAEVALDPGSYVLGAADDCDLIIADVAVAPQHCRVEVRDEGIHLVVLGGEVWHEAERLEPGETVSVLTGSLYRLGTTLVSFLREGEPWTVPSRPSLFSSEETSTPPRDDDGTASAEVPQHEVFERVVEGEERGEVKERSSARWRKRSLRIGLAVLLMVGGIGLAFFCATRSHETAHDQEVQPPVVSATPTEEDIRLLRVSLGDDSLRIASTSANVLVVSGMVSSEVERARVRTVLAAQRYPVRLRVMTSEEIQEIVTGILSGMEVSGGRVTIGADKIVHVSGFLPTRHEVEQLQRLVQQDIPEDIVTIEWDVRTLDEVEDEVRRLLRERGLERLGVKRTDRLIVVGGVVSSLQENDYREVKKQLMARYGGDKLREEVRVEAPAILPPPPLEIEGVVLGSRRFIVTSSGQKIGEGEEIGNGYVAETIHRNKVTLRHLDGIRTYLPIQPRIVMEWPW